MLHATNEYHCRSQNYLVFECDHCGDTADFAAFNQWFEIDIHGNWQADPKIVSRHFCSASCLILWIEKRGRGALIAGWPEQGSDRPRSEIGYP